MLTSETECRFELGVQVLDSDGFVMYDTLIRMYYFFAMRKVQCLSLDLCNRMRMLFGVFTVLTRHIVPFIWLKDLIWQCGVQGVGWGRGGGGIRYVVICCCGGDMYCSAWRLAPRISYIMSVQRLIILLTRAMLLETTYRMKCHIIG